MAVSKNEDNGKYMEIGFQILSVLIIPILLWVNSLNVRLALLEREIQQHEKKIEDLEEETKQIPLNKQALSDMKEDVQEARKALASIHQMLENTP